MAKSPFIQIVVSQTRGNDESLYALAQDGSVWKHAYDDTSGHFWSQISDSDRRGPDATPAPPSPTPAPSAGVQTLLPPSAQP